MAPPTTETAIRSGYCAKAGDRGRPACSSGTAIARSPHPPVSHRRHARCRPRLSSARGHDRQPMPVHGQAQATSSAVCKRGEDRGDAAGLAALGVFACSPDHPRLEPRRRPIAPGHADIGTTTIDTAVNDQRLEQANRPTGRHNECGRRRQVPRKLVSSNGQQPRARVRASRRSQARRTPLSASRPAPPAPMSSTSSTVS